MPADVVNELDPPDTINQTVTIPTVITTSGANLFTFIPFTPPSTISYVTSSYVSATFWGLPQQASIQIGDIAFKFGGSIPTSTSPNTSPWYAAGNVLSIKEIRTAEDITATYTSSYSDIQNIGIFRPNSPVSRIEIYSSSVDGGGAIYNDGMDYPDRTFTPPYSGQLAGKPTMAFIFYSVTITLDGGISEIERYSSIPPCTNFNRDSNCMDEFENQDPQGTRYQYVRYVNYNTGQSVPEIPDQPGINYILCNCTKDKSTMTYFSVTFS